MLTPFQTHKLIKEAIPSAETVYQNMTKGQITIEEWAVKEGMLKEQDAKLFNAFRENIRRACV